jgi:two-component system CheB/CheR fusion protein
MTSPSTEKPTKVIVKSGVTIVGIGASAGGLEALELFFGNMPDNSGLAFVVIQHLDPDHVGIMPELLQRITQMKVMQATDQLRIKPNYVYVIPPNKSMSLLNGTLHLFDPVVTRGLRLPIDIFFLSLANDQMEKSIGIILSGMGSDGSLGSKAIKEKGGTVMVQEPESAKFDGMPRSAVQAIQPDIIAPAEELPDKLINLINSPVSNMPDTEMEIKHRSNIDKIIILLREMSGHDFSSYKKNTLFRRIERRKSIHQIDKIQNYVRFLQENPKEIEILFRELLIGVTSFFRDTAVWDELKETVLPKLIEEMPHDHVIRAWTPACSTGEEAYSLAMIFKETMAKLNLHKNLSLQIFATDLDHDAINKARKGFFPSNITAEVSPDRIRNFFTKEADGFRVNNTIREMIVFAPQNVIKDPPFTKIDILTCRNMLIYMESDLQKKILDLFNYSLNNGGIMVLGTAESLGQLHDSFEEINPKLKIFRCTQTLISPELVDFPSSFFRPKSNSTEKLFTKAVENIQTLADHFIIQNYAPASVLVNVNGDILYITGRTGKYIEPAAGKANWNIHAMAREGLRQVLPGAFRKAVQSNDAINISNLKIGSNKEVQFVNLTIQQIENPDPLKGMVMILFAEIPAPIQPELTETKKVKGISTGRVRELEIELQQSHEELQSTREEMQTSQEELKSINEELQSTNEELQSTNEELTTSKEEMQSLNEELQTVNIELQSKVNDHARSNDDMKNLLNSTEIATLFLDKELHIRRYTDKATQIFKLRDADIDRPFTDLVSNLEYSEIEIHAREVLKNLASHETAVSTKDKRWFNVRIMPYRTVDDRIDGLVTTFTNITEAKKLEIELKRLNEELRKSKER